MISIVLEYLADFNSSSRDYALFRVRLGLPQTATSLTDTPRQPEFTENHVQSRHHRLQRQYLHAERHSACSSPHYRGAIQRTSGENDSSKCLSRQLTLCRILVRTDRRSSTSRSQQRLRYMAGVMHLRSSTMIWRRSSAKGWLRVP